MKEPLFYSPLPRREVAAMARMAFARGDSVEQVTFDLNTMEDGGLISPKTAVLIQRDVHDGGYRFDPVDDQVAIARFLGGEWGLWWRLSEYEKRVAFMDLTSTDLPQGVMEECAAELGYRGARELRDASLAMKLRASRRSGSTTADTSETEDESSLFAA